MPTINELSVEGFKNLLDEYFAPPEKRSKLDREEVIALAEILNKKINAPIISETTERKIFIKIILKIDRFLYDNLPNEFYDLVRSDEKGIDDDEAKRLVRRLSELANRQIDIPYLPEAVEHVAIRFVIGIIINASRKQWTLIKAKENALEMNIPSKENATSEELEGIIS